MRIHLDLYDRLSQVWINPTCLFLIIIAVKLLLFRASLLATVREVEIYSAASCNYLNRYAEKVQQLPERVLEEADRVWRNAVNEYVTIQLRIISMLLIVAKNLIIFFIDFFYGTATCLIGACFNGAVDFAVEAAEDVITIINLLLSTAMMEVQSALRGLENVINLIITIAEGVKSFFTGDSLSTSSTDKYINAVNLTISSLQNVQISNSTITKLEKIKDDVPKITANSSSELISDVFDQVIDRIINFSFDLNTTSIAIDTKLNQSSKDVLQICPADLSAQFGKVSNVLHRAVLWIVVALFIGVTLMYLLDGFLQYYQWRKFKRMAQDLGDQRELANVLDTLARYSSFLNLHIGPFLAKWFGSVQWVCNYCSTQRMSTVLFIGISGMFMVLAEWLLLKAARSGLNDVATSLGSPSISVANEFQLAAKNWIGSINSAMTVQNTTLNDGLLGSVLNVTESFDQGITYLSNDLNSALDIINGTVFYKPLQTAVYCIIGRKLDTVQRGIEWIHSTSIVHLPILNQTLMNLAIMDVLDDVDDIASSVRSFIDSAMKVYSKSLLIELLVSCAFIGAWLLLLMVVLLKEAAVYWWHSRLTSYSKEIIPLSVSDISTPLPLTYEESLLYGLPISDPFARTKEIS